MSVTLGDIDVLLDATGDPHFIGYPPTGSVLPYSCVRPLYSDTISLALDGTAIGWDDQFTIYCAGGSVEASFNLAVAVIKATHGQRVGGTTLAASMGYSGAQVEGHYESQVTVQLNQGDI